MTSEDETGLLDRELRTLQDSIKQRHRLWNDPGGHRLKREHIDPQVDGVAELVAALRRRDAALASLRATLGEVRQHVELFDRAERLCHEELDRHDEAIQRFTEALDEVFSADAEAAREEAAAIRLIDEAERLMGVAGAPPLVGSDPCSRGAHLARLRQTFPRIDVVHVLEGEFDGQRFSGFHSWRSCVGEVLEVGPADRYGVRWADVGTRDGDGHLVRKDAETHTMFPHGWTDEQICAEITHAFRRAMEGGQAPTSWSERGPMGLMIVGFVARQKIRAYPRRA